MELILKQVSEKLDHYSSELQSNIKELLDHFNTIGHLTDEEKKATQISFWRTMEDKSCSAVVERLLDDDQYDDEIESKFQGFSLFANWQDCISWDEIFEYTEENKTLANELEIELEVLYLQWFVENWYKAEGYLSKNVEYFLIENNSVRNFDLKRFNFTDFYENHKGKQKPNPFYAFKLSNDEIRNRVLMDYVDHISHKPISRNLKKGNEVVNFWYSKCELIIKKVIESGDTEVVFTKKIKPSEDKHTIKRECLMYITSQIDELIEKGYREV